MARLIFDLPPAALRANRRAGQHWGATHKAVREYREHCEAVINAVQWGEPKAGAVPLVVVVYVGKGQKLPDLSDVGFWAKRAIDSLVQCGVFATDSPVGLRPFLADAHRDPKHPRLEVLWGADAREYIKGVI